MVEPSRQYQPVDLLEFKRRLQARVEAARTSTEDPLAELARIIGGGGRIVSDEAATDDEVTFSGHPHGVSLAPPDAVFDPVHRPVEDPSSNYPAVVPPLGHSAGFRGGAEEDWRSFDEPVRDAGEDVPLDPPSRAYLRLRNYKRRNMSVYATSAAVLVVAGVLVAVFVRPGVSVGVAPTLRTAAAVAAKLPAGGSPAPATSMADTDMDSGARLSTAPLLRSDDSGATAPSSASPPNPSSAFTGEPLFSQPRRVQTIPVYSDGSFVDPMTAGAAPNAAQAAPAVNAAPPEAAEAQPLQLATATPPAPAAAKDAAPPSSQSQTVALREPQKVPPHPAAKTVPTGADASAGTNYSAILASPTEESEARGMLATLQKKYGAAFSGHRLTYHRVKRSAGSVYEVRVAGLADADAQTICGKLTKAGGSCEVSSQ